MNTPSVPAVEVTSPTSDKKEGSNSEGNVPQAGESNTPSTPETKVTSPTPDSTEVPISDGGGKQDLQAGESTMSSIPTTEVTSSTPDSKAPVEAPGNKNAWDFPAPELDPAQIWEDLKTTLLKTPEPVGGIKPNWLSKNTAATDTDVFASQAISWGFLEDDEPEDSLKLKEAWCTYDSLAYSMGSDDGADAVADDDNTKVEADTIAKVGANTEVGINTESADKSPVTTGGERVFQSGDWRDDLPYECLNEGPSPRCKVVAFRSVVGKDGRAVE